MLLAKANFKTSAVVDDDAGPSESSSRLIIFGRMTKAYTLSL